jgi:hypothetical protein
MRLSRKEKCRRFFGAVPHLSKGSKAPGETERVAVIHNQEKPDGDIR